MGHWHSSIALSTLALFTIILLYYMYIVKLLIIITMCMHFVLYGCRIYNVVLVNYN